jgi:DNA-binding NarL/FixJ family response regulator
MKILYVEHDDNNLYMLKTRLERCGDFEVLAAEDSERGCKLAVTEHPDVILIASDFCRHPPPSFLRLQTGMPKKSTPIPPLFKADSATLVFSASKAARST